MVPWILQALASLEGNPAVFFCGWLQPSMTWSNKNKQIVKRINNILTTFIG